MWNCPDSRAEDLRMPRQVQRVLRSDAGSEEARPGSRVTAWRKLRSMGSKSQTHNE